MNKTPLKVKKITLILLLSTISFVSFSQQGWELGGWGGIGYYFGDLNTNFSLKRPGPALGVIARYNFNDRTCLKFSGNSTILGASDSDSQNAFELSRNLSFRTLVVDGTAQFEFNFLPYIHGSKDEFYTPYLFAGASVFYFNPKAEYNGEWVALRPLGTEGQFRGDEYFSLKGAFVIGGGFKIDLSYRWSLNVECAVHRLSTDYFDDVSGVYADKDDIEAQRPNEPLAVLLSDRSWEVSSTDSTIGKPGRQRGDSTDKDIYAYLGVGILYYFGDIHCPPFSASKRKRK